MKNYNRKPKIRNYLTLIETQALEGIENKQLKKLPNL